MSSSSSSSSEEYSDSQLLPFTYESHRSSPISSMDFYGEYVFAGIKNSGMVIKSKNRYTWEKFYQTPDLSVSAIKSINGYLYIGTEPQGLIYKIKISDLTVESFDSKGSSIVDFALYNKEVYMAANGTPTVYRFNTQTNQWDTFYIPYSYINHMTIVDDILYLIIEAGNVIKYDGSSWTMVKMGADNVENLASYTKNTYPNETSIVNGSQSSFSRTIGVGCMAKDGASIIFGASNKSRVYRLLDDEIDMIFDTEGLSTTNIVNIDVGVNIVSMENKLYMIHSGELKSEEAISTTTTTTVVLEPEIQKNIFVTYPNGRDFLTIGNTVNIQWSSNKGINDAIKIELLKGETVDLIIADKISNSGSYQWEIPLSITVSNSYRIRITWLSASTPSESDVDESDNAFSIISIPTQEATTTTTTPIDTTRPDTSETRGVPILVLPIWESITELVKDDYTNNILVSTSEGRIISFNMITVNGFLTGDRTVYADVFDGFGISGKASTIYNYALCHKMAEVNYNKEIKVWKFDKDISAIKNESIKAVFYGPIVNIKNDFGFWSEIIWREVKPIGTEIIIYLRAAKSQEELLNSPWIFSAISQDGEGPGDISRSLNNVGLKGQYLQAKVEMETILNEVSPRMTELTVRYSARNSSYFYTTMFSIDSLSPAKKGMITASITTPPNTEIQFGISSVATADWNEYQLVDANKFFELNNNNLKVGIKFTSYDTAVPEVAEFAIMAGGEKLVGLNS